MPVKLSKEDQDRVRFAGRVRRLVYGAHKADLLTLLQESVGQTRADMWRPADLTATSASLYDQLAALYRSSPRIWTDARNKPVVEALEESGYWQLMARVQRDTLAMGENAVRLDIDSFGRVGVRLVHSDLILQAKAAPLRPEHPVSLIELVEGDITLTVDATTGVAVAHDSHDKDVTSTVMGESYTGDWPEAWTYTDGTRFLPYVLHHRTHSGALWDPLCQQAVYWGCLQLGVYLTYFGHCIRQAAWAQRWGLNVEPVGADAVDGRTNTVSRLEMPADPTSLAQFQQTQNGGGQAMLGQWAAPIDPQVILRAACAYETRILTLAGVEGYDVTRVEAQIRSGASLSISREAVRQVQSAFLPQFLRADREVLARTAAMINRVLGTDFNETPDAYRIEYRGIPYTSAERKAFVESLTSAVAAGLMTPIEAWLEMHPGASEADMPVTPNLSTEEPEDV